MENSFYKSWILNLSSQTLELGIWLDYNPPSHPTFVPDHYTPIITLITTFPGRLMLLDPTILLLGIILWMFGDDGSLHFFIPAYEWVNDTLYSLYAIAHCIIKYGSKETTRLTWLLRVRTWAPHSSFMYVSFRSILSSLSGDIYEGAISHNIITSAVTSAMNQIF